MKIAALFLILSGLYLAVGILFALPFVWFGVQKIDPRAAHGTWGFRLIIVPGAMLFWPWLSCRWWQGRGEPPEESNAHRQLAPAATRRPPTVRQHPP